MYLAVKRVNLLVEQGVSCVSNRSVLLLRGVHTPGVRRDRERPGETVSRRVGGTAVAELRAEPSCILSAYSPCAVTRDDLPIWPSRPQSAPKRQTG